MKKVRDKLGVPGTIHAKLISAGGTTIVDSTLASTTARCVGSYESIDSVYDGKFTPGRFRVNPVTIRKSVGYCTSGIIVYDGPATPCGKIASTEGPFAAGRNVMPIGTFDEVSAKYALAKAYAKTKDADLELVVMAGEFVETLQLLHNPMKSFKKALEKGPRNYSKFEREMDLYSGAWLTWVYGVMPLIQDITSLIEALNRKHADIGGFRRKRATVSKSELPSISYDTVGVDPSFMVRSSAVTKREHKVTAHIYYQLDVGKPSLWNSRVLGYSWSQLPVSLWQIVTRSFIVDWILDVSSWISNMTPDPSVTYLGNCVTDKCVTTYSWKCSNPKFCGTYDVKMFKPSEYSWTDTMLTRKVNLPLPALPAFNTRFLNIKNLISSLALIWGHIPRKWKRR